MNKSLENQIYGEKARSSFIFKAFAEHLLKDPKSPFQKSMKNNFYKVTDTWYLEASKLLEACVMPQMKEMLAEWIEAKSYTKSRKPLLIRVDSTKTGLHYGKHIPELKWLYDHVQKTPILTHEVFILLVSIGTRDFIVDFKICSRDHRSHPIASELLSRFLKKFSPETQEIIKEKGRLSLDGAWGTGNFASGLTQKGWLKWVIKSAGKDLVFAGEGFEEQSLADFQNEKVQYLNQNPELWKSFHPSHRLSGAQYYKQKLFFVHSETYVNALLVKFSGKPGKKSRYLLLLAPEDNTWHPFQILKAYMGRWGIESTFRSLKQNHQFNKNGQHAKNKKMDPEINRVVSRSKDEYENALRKAFKRLHISMITSFLGHMFFSEYRTLHTRPSRTSLQSVKIRLAQCLNKMSSNDLQKLFAGKLILDSN